MTISEIRDYLAKFCGEGNGESLGSCPDRKYGLCGEVASLSYCVVQNIANHLIANGVTVQQWIPVTERKPDLELVEVKNQDMDLFPCLVSKVSQGQCRKTVVTKAWWMDYISWTVIVFISQNMSPTGCRFRNRRRRADHVGELLG